MKEKKLEKPKVKKRSVKIKFCKHCKEKLEKNHLTYCKEECRLEHRKLERQFKSIEDQKHFKEHIGTCPRCKKVFTTRVDMRRSRPPKRFCSPSCACKREPCSEVTANKIVTLLKEDIGALRKLNLMSGGRFDEHIYQTGNEVQYIYSHLNSYSYRKH